MIDKLEQIKTEYEELQVKISQPDIINNQAEYKKCMKRLKSLESKYNLANEYEKILSDIAGAEEILKTEKDVELIEMAKEELNAAKSRKEELEEKIKIELLPRDPNDANDCIVEIRAGTGGDEASLFASELARMYFKYAENAGFKTEIISKSESDTGGVK